MMPYEDIQFQLVDLPPIGNESTDGWVSGILRNADMLLMILDLSEAPDIQAELLLDQLDRWRIQILKKGYPCKKEERRKYKRILLVANKTDLDLTGESLMELYDRYQEEYPITAASAATRYGIEDLRKSIFEVSGMIRIYSKEPGKDPDLGTPFTMPSGTTILELAEIIHKDFVHRLKYACIWGSSKFPGQKMHRDHILQDKDIIEFHL